MKKILGISLVAVLAVSPLMARAEVVAGEPAHADSAVQALAVPGYALAQASETNDGKVATAGYVKGAYNASIKAINTVASQVNAANNATGDLSNLTTDAKNTIVAAINEVDAHADANATAIATETSRATGVEGTLTNLTTEVKTNLVGAINEVDAHADANATAIAEETSRAETAEAGLDTRIQAIEDVRGDFATKTGTVATVNAASATYTPAGGINDVVIDTMNNWDAQTGSTITKTMTFTGTEATINPTVSGYQPGTQQSGQQG